MRWAALLAVMLPVSCAPVDPYRRDVPGEMNLYCRALADAAVGEPLQVYARLMDGGERGQQSPTLGIDIDTDGTAFLRMQANVFFGENGRYWPLTSELTVTEVTGEGFSFQGSGDRTENNGFSLRWTVTDGKGTFDRPMSWTGSFTIAFFRNGEPLNTVTYSGRP